MYVLAKHSCLVSVSSPAEYLVPFRASLGQAKRKASILSESSLRRHHNFPCKQMPVLLVSGLSLHIPHCIYQPIPQCSERQYNVIQRERLAVVYALKQFRHYLLGHPFVLHTDHAPLQWLSAQKMEGMLC